MPQKRCRPEEMIAKLREAEVLRGQGRKVPEVIGAIGISEVTYYRRRKEYGDLSVSQAKRLRDPERENAHPRHAVSDLTIDKLILQEAAGETYEPLASTPLGRSSLRGAPRLRTPSLQDPRPEPLDPTPSCSSPSR